MSGVAERASYLVAVVGSLTVIVAAIIVLIGWFFDHPEYTQLFATGPNMKTNAAVALLCAGLGNLLIAHARTHASLKLLGQALGCLSATIGALTLSQHLVGWDLQIDQLLREEASGALATTSPNRMGPPGSTVFTLLGTAIALTCASDRRWQTVRQWCIAVALVIVALPTIGYAYGFSPLYLVARYTGIALITSMTLGVLAVATLAVTPDRGLAGLLLRQDEAGRLARTLVPAATLLPLLVGLLLSRALQAEIIDGPFAVSTMALALVVGFTVVIARTGAQLARALDARLTAERALALSEQSLREADRQKTEFLATLSHELRNPLAPIRFATELLGGPPDVAARARQIIDRQVTHMVRLIEDLLDLTRITRNKLPLHREIVDVQTVVGDAVDAVSEQIREAGHEFQADGPAHQVWVDADPDRLVQVLTNLLTNAIRYTPAGGRILLSVGTENDDVIISVRDTGVGLATEHLDRVFDMFVQVGEGHHTGLGIGLALVKGLVTLHGGTVEARSAGPNQGAEFLVRMPRAANPAAPRREPQAAISLERTRILIVDDNKDAADMLGEVLTARGHDVRVVYDGAAALACVEEFRPEIGLLDLGMAPMSGHTLAARLRQMPALADLLLIAITGWGQEEDRRRALAAGFDAHLTKPAEADAVLALVQKNRLMRDNRRLAVTPNEAI